MTEFYLLEMQGRATHASLKSVQAAEKAGSASADAIDRAATIHRCSPHTDAGGHYGARNGPWPQYDAGSNDAANGIFDILTINHRACFFSARSNEAGDESRR